MPFLNSERKSSSNNLLWAENQAAYAASKALVLLETIMAKNVDEYWRHSFGFMVAACGEYWRLRVGIRYEGEIHFITIFEFTLCDLVQIVGLVAFVDRLFEWVIEEYQAPVQRTLGALRPELLTMRTVAPQLLATSRSRSQ